jgi:hypothetical protein
VRHEGDNIHGKSELENVLDKSLSQRERVARASGPGEGYRKEFANSFSVCTPHPPLRGTLSRWERDLPQNFFL